MARRGRSSIYVSTNPNVPISIGTPGVSVFIGTPGPTIYGSGGNNLPASGLLQFIGAPSVTFTPVTVPVVMEF